MLFSSMIVYCVSTAMSIQLFIQTKGMASSNEMSKAWMVPGCSFLPLGLLVMGFYICLLVKILKTIKDGTVLN
jgi:hypothetical protein